MQRQFGKTPKDFREVCNVFIDHANLVRNIKKNQLNESSSKGEKLTLSFDEWTNGRAAQFINLIANSGTNDYNLGLVKLTSSANAENLTCAIAQRLANFDIRLSDVKVLMQTVPL